MLVIWHTFEGAISHSLEVLVLSHCRVMNVELFETVLGSVGLILVVRVCLLSNAICIHHFFLFLFLIKFYIEGRSLLLFVTK